MTDLELSVSSNGTCLRYKMKHWCEKYTILIDRKYLEDCDLLSRGNICGSFSSLFRSISINVVNTSLQKGILRTFSLIHQELGRITQEKKFRLVNFIFQYRELVSPIQKVNHPMSTTPFAICIYLNNSVINISLFGKTNKKDKLINENFQSDSPRQILNISYH